jgi:hypothetical protein
MRKRLLALVFVVGALSVGPATAASASTTTTAPAPASAAVNAVSATASGYVPFGRYWS